MLWVPPLHALETCSWCLMPETKPLIIEDFWSISVPSCERGSRFKQVRPDHTRPTSRDLCSVKGQARIHTREEY